MQIKLFFLLVAFSAVGYSQPVIQSFYGDEMPANYTLLQEITPFDQSASGANATWSLNTYDEIGHVDVSFPLLTDSEVIAFPNSTGKIMVRAGNFGIEPATSEIFVTQSGNAVSLTGFTAPGLTINYQTNNAKIGDYPMSFGYSNADTSAGNYQYGDYSGTFTGTITTQADAYGTLLIGTDSFEVSRSKTIQTLSMNYSIFSNVGTFTQTIYNYYAVSTVSGEPLLRTTTTSISVPLLSINETLTSIDAFPVFLLATQDNSILASKVTIAPNPVDDVLHLEIASELKLLNVTVMDANGKTVLVCGGNDANTESLSKGIYFARITTDAGSVVKKMIRK